MGSVVEDLRAVLPSDRVLTDPALLEYHRRDKADLCDAGCRWWWCARAAPPRCPPR
nr:hypothetical protein GCM10017745_42380 [Saccharothrix mutabilis subsp. capreolus]